MITAGSLAIILFISFVFAWAAKKLHFSEVIGLMLAGVFFSLPWFRYYFIGEHQELVINLGHISIIALMFVAGLEVSWSMLKREEKDALLITLSTITVSLLTGIIILKIVGYKWEAAIIVGICFGITAEATKARALIQLKKLQTKLGALLMGVGIINDVIGVLFLVIVSLLFTSHFVFKDVFLLIAMIASFGLGIYAHYRFDRYSFAIKRLERFLFVLVIPFFFVAMGHYINQIEIVNFTIIILILFGSLFSQMLGVYITKPFTKLRPKQLYLVGWGMNSKGLVELVIAFVALQLNIIDLSLYSAIVISSFILTLCFQLIIFKMVKNSPEIMD